MKAKKSGKKVGKKKAVIRKDILKNANADHYFFVNDGTVLRNVLDLSKQLDKMADEVFEHHVNGMRNDFSNWIKYVFKEEKLAEELLKTTNKDKTQIILLKYVIGKFK